MDVTIYNRAPHATCNGIPVFHQTDDYSANYDQIAKDHLLALEGGLPNPFIPESIWQIMEHSTLALLRKYGVPGDNVLDVGVGLGRLLGQAPEFQRYGVDISLPYLEHARKQGITVCCAGVEALPYHKEFFDVVVCTDVLEHVIDLNRAIDALLCVLKPGGVLIIRVPDSENLSPYLAPDYPYRFAHLRSFDQPGVRLLFSRVFHCEFLEGALVFVHQATKMKGPFPLLLRRVFTRVITQLTACHSGLFSWTARTLFHPVEFNAVFRKPAASEAVQVANRSLSKGAVSC